MNWENHPFHEIGQHQLVVFLENSRNAGFSKNLFFVAWATKRILVKRIFLFWRITELELLDDVSVRLTFCEPGRSPDSFSFFVSPSFLEKSIGNFINFAKAILFRFALFSMLEYSTLSSSISNSIIFGSEELLDTKILYFHQKVMAIPFGGEIFPICLLGETTKLSVFSSDSNTFEVRASSFS